MPETNNPPQDDNLDAPPRLVSALKDLQWGQIFIPPRVDRAILDQAQKQFAGKRPRNFLAGWRWWVAGSAIALMAGALFIRLSFFQPRTRSTTPPVLSEDLNHDGQIDILDALALARALQTGHATGLGADVNGDGIVDEKDVAGIAADAVRLEKGRRS